MFGGSVLDGLPETVCNNLMHVKSVGKVERLNFELKKDLYAEALKYPNDKRLSEVRLDTRFNLGVFDVKCAVLPFDTSDKAIADLWKKYGYGDGSEEKNRINFRFEESDKHETERLSRRVQALAKKVSRGKVEDKKEGDGNRESDAEDVWGSSDMYGAEEPMNCEEKPRKVLRKKRKSNRRELERKKELSSGSAASR